MAFWGTAKITPWFPIETDAVPEPDLILERLNRDALQRAWGAQICLDQLEEREG